jgi:hypothetical protein
MRRARTGPSSRRFTKRHILSFLSLHLCRLVFYPDSASPPSSWAAPSPHPLPGREANPVRRALPLPKASSSFHTPAAFSFPTSDPSTLCQ